MNEKQTWLIHEQGAKVESKYEVFINREHFIVTTDGIPLKALGSFIATPISPEEVLSALKELMKRLYPIEACDFFDELGSEVQATIIEILLADNSSESVELAAALTQPEVMAERLGYHTMTLDEYLDSIKAK